MKLAKPLVTLVTAALLALPLPAYAETQAQPAGENIAAVAATAKPSVVGILTTMKANRSTDRGRAAGTGWVYKAGVIITNAHVVENATEVKILYPNKTVETVQADKIFADKTADIAVIQVAAKGLNPLPQGNSDQLTIGQTVVAIGNPLGFRLGNSVSSGILSGTGRALGSGYPFLQLDAAINPGNSGGPLFNLKGEVIGINSAKMADVGVEGLAFAIPVHTARQVADALLRDGKVERPTLGISLDEGWEAYFGVPNAEGVTIARVVPFGPAGLSALRSGDKLVKLDDTPIYTSDDVYSFLLGKRSGDLVKVTVKRSGQILSAHIKLASQEALRKEAEEQGQELGGILMDLTAGQIQEAAEFGRNISRRQMDINDEYVAINGGNYAVLNTEFLYVARRIAAAYDFGFTPGVGFQQSVAKEINRKVEIKVEIQGDKANFLQDATFTLEQGGTKNLGALAGPVSYTSSQDGSLVIGDAAVRFSTANLNAVDDLVFTVKASDGKTTQFHFTIKDLR